MSMEERRYRHEYKYPLTNGEVLIEQAKLRELAELDAHTGPEGRYQIRSLYFDDYDNSCYMSNENGEDNREKYRIRIYNHDPSRIQLEIKQKLRGKTNKRSCLLDKTQCDTLIVGEIPKEIRKDQPELHKLAYLMATRLMKPAVIVDYERIPYVYRSADANVRITFDSRITSIREATEFFNKEAVGREVLPTGRALMEVKFDDFLPDEIYALLQLKGLSVSTFSKYYLCRKFMM